LKNPNPDSIPEQICSNILNFKCCLLFSVHKTIINVQLL
jgi:hypothetical protein